MSSRISLAIVCIALICVKVSADIPQVVGYQGMITDNGSPVADGSYSMRFRIFDAATGGNLEWDSGTMSVSLSAGIFSVLLGESPQPSMSLGFEEDYWLLVTFEGVNQTPRQRLGSVGYAYMASGLVPGTVISGEVTADSNAGIKAINTATIAVSYGIHGESNSMAGRGIYGAATRTTGVNFGVFGESASTSGRGVYGVAISNTGGSYGVYGIAHSSSGYGVYGFAPVTAVCGYAHATSGLTAGVYGENSSTEGYGVHGYALKTEGSAYGVYGHTASTDGKGVVGSNYSTEGYADGVVGLSSSPYGKGVQGYNYSTTGSAVAVGGQSNSTQGRAVYGLAQSTTGTNFGVYGLTSSSQGRGVYGLATATSGICFGVYGECFSTGEGAGVYGLSSSTLGYGICGENDGGGLAGKFEGDVDVNGRLELPDNDATPTVGTGSLQIGDASRALKLDGNEIITNTGEVLHIQRDNNGDLQVDNGTLTVDASLNRVGIGTSAPDEALTVYGRVYVSNMDGTSDGYTVRWYDNRLYYLVSSSAYKEDIRKLDDDFEAILKAVPRSFTDKASGKRCIGFIAEEFDQLGLSNLVQYQSNEPHTVKYEMVSLYLLEVIKELKRENEEFAKRLAVLENK